LEVGGWRLEAKGNIRDEAKRKIGDEGRAHGKIKERQDKKMANGERQKAKGRWCGVGRAEGEVELKAES
jgi:hypothetical protein